MKQNPLFLSTHVGKRAPKGRGRRAFSLLELLVTILMIGLIASVAVNYLGQTLPRYKLRGKATEVSGFFQKARMAAIRAGLDVSVEIVEMGDSEEALIAYRNNRDGTKTDLFRVMVGSPIRHTQPYLGGSASSSVEGAKANTFPDSKVIYRFTGNAAETGALRVSIGRDQSLNTIEVAITSLGGQPVLRKYIAPADRPPGAPVDQEFFKETHYGTDWRWVWY